MKNIVIPIHFKAVDSTNMWAKKHYASLHRLQLTRITTDLQFKGCGRFNHRWISPNEGNIYLTYVFKAPKRVKLNNLAQMFALSVSKLLRREGFTPTIKWPNDILINNKKVAGILCEMLDIHMYWGVILGVGINVNMQKQTLNTIDQAATSLHVEMGRDFSTKRLIYHLDFYFSQDLQLYLREGFAPFYMFYNELLTHNRRQAMTLRYNHMNIQGTFHSLDSDGYLNILLPSGKVKNVRSGVLTPVQKIIS